MPCLFFSEDTHRLVEKVDTETTIHNYTADQNGRRDPEVQVPPGGHCSR